jgi:hypothetical protein
VAGAQAINWVSGSVPVTDNPDANPPPVFENQAPELPYPPGTRLQVIAPAGLNIRVQPTTSAEIAGSVVQGDIVFMLTSPPVVDGTLVWWEVRSEKDGVSGWIAAQIDGEVTVGL